MEFDFESESESSNRDYPPRLRKGKPSVYVEDKLEIKYLPPTEDQTRHKSAQKHSSSSNITKN